MLNGLYRGLEFFVIQIRVYPGGSHSMRPSTSGSYRSYSTTREVPVAGLGPAWPGQARPRGRLSQDSEETPVKTHVQIFPDSPARKRESRGCKAAAVALDPRFSRGRRL